MPERTIDEVWSDLNLPPLGPAQPTRDPPPEVTLQDFLAQSFHSAKPAPAHSPHLISFASSPSVSSVKRPPGHVDTHERRHKRMMKNRESAARSRARKQAYTYELELEVAQLIQENAKLRKQQEKLMAAVTNAPKKHKLYRTSTAPF